jgi:hypothetical protein
MELTAQELRIGNLVQIVKYWKDFYDENYFIPKEINLDDLRAINNFKDIAKPIPLTEEWLLRFGFIRKYVSHTPYILNDISIYPTDANFYNIVYYKGVKIDDIILKSVSQLQNLYFSLTNNELKLIK